MDNHTKTIADWVQFSTKTDVGKTRQINEDRIFVDSWPDQAALLAVVADGMGGHQSGEVAAQIAAETLSELIQEPLPHDPAQLYQRFAQQFRVAHARIQARASQGAQFTNMGTTIVAAIVTPSHYLYLHAGDCRFYHFHRQGRVLRRSRDHSIVQMLIDLKQITEEQAAHHPMRSIVNSCLGGREDKSFSLDPAWNPSNPPIYPYQAGDILLLCSDGLHGAISAAQLQQAIRTCGQDLNTLTTQCVGLALDGGGEDNISVVAIARSGA